VTAQWPSRLEIKNDETPKSSKTLSGTFSYSYASATRANEGAHVVKLTANFIVGTKQKGKPIIRVLELKFSYKIKNSLLSPPLLSNIKKAMIRIR
jgi:hypothetical protein